MENNTYKIQGQTFQLLPNDLSLLNKAAPMIARLRKLVYEYTKDIDTTSADKYNERINELSESKQQLEEIINSGMDENGNELTEDSRNKLNSRINELTEKHKLAVNEFNNDAIASGALKLKQELEGYALIELLTDIDFLKPILKKILVGGSTDNLNFNDGEAIGFIRSVVTDFFTVMNRNSFK